jgi:hypothetical protein
MKKDEIRIEALDISGDSKEKRGLARRRGRETIGDL